MFCKNCGRQIPDNATFCPACGTKRSGSDTFGEEKSGRDIKNLPNYAKENDLNRSGDAIDTNRQKFSLSGNGKRFSLSGSDQQKFSLSGQKKFSLSDKGKDSGDGIVRISTNREPAASSKAPTGFVNPLKDSGQNIHWGSDGDRNETQNAGFADDPSEIESHLGFAVFTLLCCCQPTSILAILFAVLVSQEVKKGNYEQAQKYSNLAKLFCWISIGLSIFCGGISSITNMNEWSSVIRSPVNP